MQYFSLPPRLKKILHRALTGVSLLSLVLIATVALALKVPILGSWQAFAIQTGSMEPTIPTGALIFTRTPPSHNAIRVGDIITFEKPGFQGQLITHRVHTIDDSGSFITKGDANQEPDDWVVPFGRVKGTGNWNVPLAGKAITFLQSPLGLILFVLLPVLIIIWQEGRNIVNALVEHKLDRFFTHLNRAGYRIIPPNKNKPANDRNIQSRSSSPPPAGGPGEVDRPKGRSRGVYEKSKSWLQTHVKSPITHKVPITTMIILATISATPAFAYFISNSVSINGNTISTADTFPTSSPSPSPSPSPTTSPSPATSPTASPTTSPTPEPSGQVAGDCDIDLEANLENINTGEGSTNTNDIHIQTDCDITETNQADIDNTVEIDANTGNNQQNQNTQDGNLETGDINIDLNTNTTVNSN